MNKINLSGSFSAFWNAVTSGWPKLGPFLAIIGVALVIFAFAKWMWDRRRGGGGDSKGLMWTIALGALMAAPSLILPLVLGFIDWIANIVVNILQKGK